MWVHNKKGMTVIRIQCTGTIKVNEHCQNLSAHTDINVNGDIEICIP